MIVALEDNQFEELGAPVFARGHLRKYARLLNLDPREVLRAYDVVATEQSVASLEVSPASDLPLIALESGAALIIINYQPTYLDSKADVVIQGNVAEVLPQVVGLATA